MNIDVTDGKFGWEEFKCGILMPYIIRDNEKLCSIDMFNAQVLCKRENRMVDQDLLHFEGLPLHPLKRDDTYLMNEINHIHCDSMFEHHYKTGDRMVEVSDVAKMCQFIYDVHHKLFDGVEYKLSNAGILSVCVTNDKDYRVPYVIIASEMIVPLSHCPFFSGVPKRNVQLTGIGLQYMKFMLKVLRLNDTIGDCLPWNEIYKAVGRMYVTEYWPDDDLLNQFYKIQGGVFMSMRELRGIITNVSGLQTESSTKNENIDRRESETADRQKTAEKTSKKRMASKPKKKARTSSEEYYEMHHIVESRVNGDYKLQTKSSTQNESIEGRESESTGRQKRSKKQMDQSSKPKKKARTSSEEYYEIHHIVESRVNSDGSIEGLVRWKGYSSKYDSWECFDNFTDDLKAELTESVNKSNSIRATRNNDNNEIK